MRPDGGHGDAVPSWHLHRLQALRGAGSPPASRCAAWPAGGPARTSSSRAASEAARPSIPGLGAVPPPNAHLYAASSIRFACGSTRHRVREPAGLGLLCARAAPAVCHDIQAPARMVHPAGRSGRAGQRTGSGAGGAAAGGAQSGMRGVLAGRASPKRQAFAVPAGRPEPACRAALGRGNTGYGTEGQSSSRQEAACKGHAGKAGRLGAARAAGGLPPPPAARPRPAPPRRRHAPKVHKIGQGRPAGCFQYPA